jgi:DNA-binding GntR family transcriptional regulator
VDVELAIADEHGAIRVTTVSVRDAIELYDCRLAMESLSVAQACDQATPAQLTELQTLVDQAEKLPPLPQDPLRHYQRLDLDHRFHRLLAQSSNNRYLSRLLDQIFDRMLLLRLQTTRQHPGVLEIHREHRCIYEAIQNRQPDQAVAALQAHLRASRDRVIKALQEGPGVTN